MKLTPSIRGTRDRFGSVAEVLAAAKLPKSGGDLARAVVEQPRTWSKP